jgi:hypothetical protein
MRNGVKIELFLFGEFFIFFSKTKRWREETHFVFKISLVQVLMHHILSKMKSHQPTILKNTRFSTQKTHHFITKFFYLICHINYYIKV